MLGHGSIAEGVQPLTVRMGDSGPSILSPPSAKSAQQGGYERSNTPNAFGVAPLHTAVWNNDLAGIDILLQSGATPDVPDVESGWTCLHRALYFGRIHAASKLLGSGGSLRATDAKGRTPVDLASAELKRVDAPDLKTEVCAWGSGSNFQLGTGSTGLALTPHKVDALREVTVRSLAASKFHSVALTLDGRLFTWGWGRGGRLGHQESHIHSGNGAQIFPRPVGGLLGKKVIAVGAAKHHMVAVTSAGDVFTWGSNRDGKLGYQAVDTQVVPRKVAALKNVVATRAAAANRNTAVLTSDGEVYTWGANSYGQLGYGTSDSGSNPSPRRVDALKGKVVRQVALSKRHAVVVMEQGEVYTWGNKRVAPRRVMLAGARDAARSADVGEGPLVQFHTGVDEVHKPAAVMVSAADVHSCCLTRAGVILCWHSADPGLRPLEVGYALSGKRVVFITAGKTRTLAVTDKGDVYAWEGKPGSGFQHKGPGYELEAIVPERVEGLKRVTLGAVGEKHTLALQSWMAPRFLKNIEPLGQKSSAEVGSAAEGDNSSQDDSQDDSCDGLWEAAADQFAGSKAPVQPRSSASDAGAAPTLLKQVVIPSLQELCQQVVAETVVAPRNSLQILGYADSVHAISLRTHCLKVAVWNLDMVLWEGEGMLEHLGPHVLQDMERRYQTDILKLGPAQQKPWWLKQEAMSLDNARGRRPTLLLLPEKEEATEQVLRSSPPSFNCLQSLLFSPATSLGRHFLPDRKPSEADSVARLTRKIKKKLQQIDHLKMQEADGGYLDDQQRAKTSKTVVLERALAALKSGAQASVVEAILAGGDKALAVPWPDHLGPCGSSPPKPNNSNEGKKKRRKKKKAPVQSGNEACEDGGGANLGHTEAKQDNGKETAVVAAESSSAAPVLGDCESVGTEASEPVRKLGFQIVAKPVEVPALECGRAAERKNGNVRRGALSSFLKGELDDPKPTRKEHAWGGVHTSHSQRSLREIINEQEAVGSHKEAVESQGRLLRQQQVPERDPRRLQAPDSSDHATKLSLGDFMPRPSYPPKKSGPAWAAGAGTPKNSLADIQAEQQLKRKGSAFSWGSPSETMPAGGVSSACGAARPCIGKPPPESKWYVPEEIQVQSISAIQVEETALRELRRMYGDGRARAIKGTAKGMYRPPPNS